MFKDKRDTFSSRKAFTLIEVSVALIILGMIAATVLVVLNNAMDKVVIWQTKMQAFEIVRENMEKILTQSTVSDMTEMGTSELNPDITWDTKVESFYEPITSKMWIRAVCSAEFPDANGEPKKIELSQWLTGLDQQQIMKILEQKKKLEAYQATFDDPNEALYELGLMNEEDVQQQNDQTDARQNTNSDKDATSSDTSDDVEMNKVLEKVRQSETGR